jgi:hypothetical protein
MVMLRISPRMEATVRRGHADLEPPVVIAERLHGEEFAGRIDVTEDDMAVEAAGGGEGALEIHR